MWFNETNRQVSFLKANVMDSQKVYYQIINVRQKT